MKNDTVLEILQYGISCSRITWSTSTNPANRSAANIKYTNLTKTSSKTRDSLDFFFSFEASLIERRKRDNSKGDSFGNIRV